MSSKTSKSFTLIELLVLIAIIAIIASIILISLSSVRNKSKDAKTISQLSQIPSKVAIDYYTIGEYDICETSSSFKESSGLKSIENEIEERNGTITCYSEGSNYCISTQLLQGDYYCIKNNQKGRYSAGCTSATEGCENIVGEEEEEEWACGDILVDERDDNEYKTVQMGGQCWMAENLNVGIKIDNLIEVDGGYDPLFQEGDCVDIKKYCANNDISNCNTYGGLYQWWQAVCLESWRDLEDDSEFIEYSCNGTGQPPNDSCSNPIRGICPLGWHIPSVYEMTTLLRAVCTSDSCETDFEYNLIAYELLGTTEGDKLKKAGLCKGRTPCGTSGFDMLDGGLIDGYDFKWVSEASAIWTSSFIHSSPIFYANFEYYPQILRDGFYVMNSLSIRCIKD